MGDRYGSFFVMPLVCDDMAVGLSSASREQSFVSQAELETSQLPWTIYLSHDNLLHRFILI